MLSMAIIIAITITIIFTVIFTPEEENVFMTTNKENEYSNLCDLPIILQGIYIHIYIYIYINIYINIYYNIKITKH